jgi:prolipoprotein diacylglyceryl transferase
MPARILLDTLAPALPIAQAIGRLGNWFSQELFGRPTTRFWGLGIDPSHRPSGYQEFATFHPTFLYEAIWNLGVAGVLIALERRLRLRPGGLFALYLVLYTAGRTWIELLRIDRAPRLLGLRFNIWTSLLVMIGSIVWLARSRRPRLDEMLLVDSVHRPE